MATSTLPKPSPRPQARRMSPAEIGQCLHALGRVISQADNPDYREIARDAEWLAAQLREIARNRGPARPRAAA